MLRLYSRTLSVGLALFNASCGHTQAVGATAQPNQQPAPHDAHASHQPENARHTDSRSSADLNTLMKEHFVIGLLARNAVIDGTLEPMRGPMRALSDYGFETFPIAWMGGINRMQAAARTASNADSLEAAASGIAALAGACGSCHFDQGHVVPVEKQALDGQTQPSDGIAARMSRHAWAVERLWDGLVAPSDEAWLAGAAALARAPMQAPEPKGQASGDFADELTELRNLGIRGQHATAMDTRVDVYGRVLATCSRCHADVDGHDQGRQDLHPR